METDHSFGSNQCELPRFGLVRTMKSSDLVEDFSVMHQPLRSVFQHQINTISVSNANNICLMVTEKLKFSPALII